MSSFSPTRLARLHDGLVRHVERGDLPGLVAMVSHGHDVHVETLGTLSLGGPAPMRRDTIFRISSLTKLVTAVAAMILIEDCKLRLDQSIELWLPELAGRRVLPSLASELDETVPARRAITVRDLLTSTMGLGSIMAAPGTYPIQSAIRDLQIGGDGPPKPALAPATDEWLRRLGSLPLLAQPGERWMYHISIETLGALIARVAGQSLGAFMQERIFAPLGMSDTGFHVSADQAHRLPPCYFFDRQTHALSIFDGVADSAWGSPPPMEMGAGGLVSTLDDFAAFCRMLLNRGRFGRQCILTPVSVALMTSDQLMPAQRVGAGVFLGDHSSWGLGMAVGIQHREIYQNLGRFGWDGGLGGSAYLDPSADMFGILFTQRMMDSPEAPQIYSDFWTLAYAALA